jgi:virginiamycin B lyase
VNGRYPTPEFARDPAPAPDGAIYIAVMHGNRIARFDPGKQAFTEWPLPENANPHGLVVDAQGIVWYTGNGNGSDRPSRPGNRSRYVNIVPHQEATRTPSSSTSKADLWFTVQRGQRVVRLDRGQWTVHRVSEQRQSLTGSPSTPRG